MTRASGSRPVVKMRDPPYLVRTYFVLKFSWLVTAGTGLHAQHFQVQGYSLAIASPGLYQYCRDSILRFQALPGS